MNVTWKLFFDSDRSFIRIDFTVDRKRITGCAGSELIVWYKHQVGSEVPGPCHRDGILKRNNVDIYYTPSLLFQQYYEKIVLDIKKMLVKEML